MTKSKAYECFEQGLLKKIKPNLNYAEQSIKQAEHFMDFAGKAVVVTGAGSGIGRETALAFAKRGARLALIGRGMERLLQTEKDCLALGCPKKAMSIRCDVGGYAQVKRACARIKKDFGAVDILVNNAGFGIYGAFRDIGIEEIENLMRINYLGTVYFTKELLPLMGRGSHIVNISSMAGKLPLTNYSGYCASKFAVWAFSESICHELRKDGIGVHLICPSATRTHFFDNESFAGHPHTMHPEKMADPKDVAGWIIDAIEKGRLETISPSLKERVAVFLLANAPWLYHHIMQSRYVAQHCRKE